MEWDTIKLSWPERGLALIMLNRPERANAINATVLRELDQLCTQLSADADLRSVVVTGAGNAFSSGFDLKEQAEHPPSGVSDWSDVLDADFKGIMALWHMPVPVVAAVNGPALAGGFELMLACDLAVASDEAVFGEPELKFGAGIVAMLLPWFVNPRQAAGVIFTANDAIDAQQALEWGLVNKVVEHERVLEAALGVAYQISKLDPMVVRRTKMALRRTYEIMGMPVALRAALDLDKMIEGEGSDVKREFLKIIRTEGMASALKWRADRSG